MVVVCSGCGGGNGMGDDVGVKNMVVVAYIGGGSHDSWRLLMEMWQCLVGDGGSGEDDVDGGVIVVVWMWWPTKVAGTTPKKGR
nr:hypothetical protein [Tanacetum cinerariifolium]